MRSLLSVLLAVTVAQTLGSCHHFHEPIFDVRDRKLLPIPLRDLTAPRNRRWYGESERGVRAVRAFQAWCESEATGNFLHGPDADRIVRAVTTGWLEDSIRERDWQEITAGADVDLILVGEITEFRHKQPGDIGFYRGSAKIEYQIIHARTGRPVYRTPAAREVLYPEPDSTNLPFYDLDANKNIGKVERGLILKLGARLGEDLYGYYDH